MNTKHIKSAKTVELGSKEMISKDLLVYWVYWLLWTHQKCRHIVEVESKERISTVSPLIPSPPIWPTNWPSTTCGQSLKVSLQLKRQSYWDQIHGVTRPEISFESDNMTFFVTKHFRDWYRGFLLKLTVFESDTKSRRGFLLRPNVFRTILRLFSRPIARLLDQIFCDWAFFLDFFFETETVTFFKTRFFESETDTFLNMIQALAENFHLYEYL